MRRVVLGLLLLASACDQRREASEPLPESEQPPDRIARAAVTLPDRSIVVSRRGDAPGETDLYLIPPSGKPQPLAPAEGSDDMPVVMDDGKIAFVSTRSTIASIWLLDPKTGRTAQITNRGLVAGKKLDGFVPPPMHSMKAIGSELHYESAPGVHWIVDVKSGQARRAEEKR